MSQDKHDPKKTQDETPAELEPDLELDILEMLELPGEPESDEEEEIAETVRQTTSPTPAAPPRAMTRYEREEAQRRHQRAIDECHQAIEEEYDAIDKCHRATIKALRAVIAEQKKRKPSAEVIEGQLAAADWNETVALAHRRVVRLQETAVAGHRGAHLDLYRASRG